jgi:ParB-like chromosome segregation protein Spo0J
MNEAERTAAPQAGEQMTAGPPSLAGNSVGAIVPIASIKPGTRHRRDMGDIEALAASIAEIGLLNPITVAKDGTLLAGQRRLEAFKLLGRTEIPVMIWEGPDA